VKNHKIVFRNIVIVLAALIIVYLIVSVIFTAVMDPYVQNGGIPTLEKDVSTER
jgi:hypothetical protein